MFTITFILNQTSTVIMNIKKEYCFTENETVENIAGPVDLTSAMKFCE